MRNTETEGVRMMERIKEKGRVRKKEKEIFGEIELQREKEGRRKKQNIENHKTFQFLLGQLFNLAHLTFMPVIIEIADRWNQHALEGHCKH